LKIENITDADGNIQTVIRNQKAMKNLANGKEKTDLLNMDFVWKYREPLCKLAREI